MGHCIQKLGLLLNKNFIDADKVFKLFSCVLAFVCTPIFAVDLQIEQGFKWMFDRNVGNCVTCHQIKPGQGANEERLKEIQGDFAPSLQGVGARYTRTELLQWVRDARKIHPDTLMPPYGTLEGVHLPNTREPMLNEQQIQSIVSALESLR